MSQQKKGTTNADANGPELTDEDERILNRIWDNIAKDHKASDDTTNDDKLKP